MNFGNGIGLQSNSLPSAFAPTAANEGASVDVSTRKIVLGDDFALGTNNSELNSPRFIPMNGLFIRLGAAVGDPEFVAFSSHNIRIQTDVAGSGQHPELFMNNGAVSFTLSIDTSTGAVLLGSGNGNFLLNPGTGNFQLQTAAINPDSGAKLQVDGAIETAPANGFAGQWKLGTVQAAGVALDATHFVQVDINGTPVKLAIVT
jgi:hypothetical protein